MADPDEPPIRLEHDKKVVLEAPEEPEEPIRLTHAAPKDEVEIDEAPGGTESEEPAAAEPIAAEPEPAAAAETEPAAAEPAAVAAEPAVPLREKKKSRLSTVDLKKLKKPPLERQAAQRHLDVDEAKRFLVDESGKAADWARGHAALAGAAALAVCALLYLAKRALKRRALRRRTNIAKKDFNRWDPRPSDDGGPSWASSVLPPTVKAAAQRGERDAVLQWLASPVGNADARDSDQRTAVHHAVSHGHAELARALLENGASPDSLDVDGQTALHVAARVGSAASARVLLDAGADVTLDDKAGRTPRQLAEAAGNHGCARLIVRRERAIARSLPNGAKSGSLNLRRNAAADREDRDDAV
ncbi:ankyrin repeat-containing domain protein [Pelagophyceae sp. CCMP2097]|nr:ankyrin repeat-containing domain protein [Pelagophyceae sp. CCMP2097]